MASSPAQSPKLHHIVAMPYPGCGHINPLLNLAGHLSTHGLLVTVVLTEEWLSFLSPPPSAVQFRSIPNVNPSEHGRANDLNGFLYAVNTKLEKPFECLLEVLDPPPPVILADTYLSLSVLERERERERERATMAEKVINKQVLFKDYVTGFPKEEDMVFTSSTIDLKLPQGSTAVLVKNLYLSCDPYMRPRMSRPLTQSYTDALVPGKSIGNTKLFV